MFGLGSSELIVIAVILFLLFGAKRIPEIGKGLGGAIREFRNIKKEFRAEKAPDGCENNQKTPNMNCSPGLLEGKVEEKVLEQIPAVKKAMDIKKKAEQVKKIVQ
jgi:sec-independent protein translocase protein TatA